MAFFFAVVLLGLAAALAASAVLSRTHWFAGFMAARLASRMGLGIPADLADEIRSRVATRTLWTSLGGLIGLAVAGAVLETGDLDLTYFRAFGAILGAGAGTGLGAVFSALQAEKRREAGTPRVARLTAVSVGDYVVTTLRILAWSLFGLAVLAVIVSAATSAGGFSANILAGRLTSRIVVLAIALFILVFFEVSARWIVARGRPTSSTDEMVWDDALRAAALRDLLGAAPLSLFYVTLYTAVGHSTQTQGATFAVSVVALVVFVLYALVFRWTRTWYLEQLWPGARRRSHDEEAARLEGSRAR